MKECVIDFDETLIRVDSLWYILKRERLWKSPRLFGWGVCLWVARSVLSRTGQLPVRRRFKFILLGLLQARGSKLIDKYALEFQPFLNKELIDRVSQAYPCPVVITSSWEPLALAVLERGGLGNWRVKGTVLTARFADFQICWHANKLVALSQLSITTFDLFTDSEDDRPLMEKAQSVTMVSPPPVAGAEETKVCSHWYLVVIVAVAFGLRVAGSAYGLPLWLVGDETALVYGALKMIELRTIVPALHYSAFAGVFYYGPFIPYLYLGPFLATIGFKWLWFPGTFFQFKNVLLADPSALFYVARIISGIAGALSVLVVYRIAKNIFYNQAAALWSAVWLATSLLAVDYAHWARHWTILTLLLAVVIMIVTEPQWGSARRYVVAAAVVGLGMGFNVQAAFGGIFIALWVLGFERVKPLVLIKKKWFWQAIAVFVIPVVGVYFLWPRSFDFITVNTDKVVTVKSLGGFLQSLWFHLGNLFKAEPLLLFFSAFGLALGLIKKWRLFVVLELFSVAYLAVIYAFLQTTDRFILLLYPVAALYAGFGLTHCLSWIGGYSRGLRMALGALCVLLPLGVAIRFDFLLIKNDTRYQAIRWVEAQLPATAKIVVAAPLTRMIPTVEALTEQQFIDPGSLRSMDKALLDLPENLYPSPPRFVLNTYTITTSSWFTHLDLYLQSNRYDYLVLAPSFAAAQQMPSLSSLGLIEIKRWKGSWRSGLLTPGHEHLPDGFGAGMREIFSTTDFGPEMVIYKTSF